MLSQWEQAFSLLGCDSLDNPAKSSLSLAKILFPVSIYNSLPKGGRRTESKLPVVRVLSSTATYAPRFRSSARPR